MENTKKLLLTAIVLLGFTSGSGGQDLAVQGPAANALRLDAKGFEPSSARPTLGMLMKAEPLARSMPAEAAPEPRLAPQFSPEDKDRNPWQLAVGYQYVRFRSAAIDASLNGLHTSLTYYLNDSIGVEGSVVAAFGSSIFSNEHPKYLLYTGGPLIVWPRRGWSPWGHALIGGLHLLPQIAGGFSQNSFAVQVGGGADYRVAPPFFFRVEGDYVRSHLYSTSQNNFQLGAGVTFQF